MGFTVAPFDPVADAKQRAAKIRQLNSQVMASLAKLDEAYNTFWQSKDPQAVANELGTDGPPMFGIHAELNQIRVQVLLHDIKMVAVTGVALTPGADPKLPASYGPKLPTGYTASVDASGKLVIAKS